MFFPQQALGSIGEYQTGKIWHADQIANAAGRCAGVLADRGVGRGDVVFIYHGGSGAFFADLLGVWKAGACAACLNPGLTQPELENITQFIKPKLILVDEKTPPVDVGPVAMLCSQVGDAALGSDSTSGGNLDDAALILFTSGTTGTPKSVVHTFRSLLSRINLNRTFIGDAALGRTLSVLPTHFGHGLIGNCLTPLLFGHHLLLAPGSNLSIVSKLDEIIDQNDIRFMSSVPTFWKLVIKLAKSPKKNTLQRIQVGSAPLSADLWRQIIDWSGIDDVVNMYGITETANWLAGASARDHEPEDGLIGSMWGGFAAVKTDAGTIESVGEGELLVQSPSLMSSYYELEEVTNEVLIDGWFHTGDIGRIDENGTMCLTGRLKNEINRAGMKIHPEDLDLLFERHEEIQEACAFGLADELSGEAVGVAICLIDGASIDIKEIRSWCVERLAPEKRPDKWFLVPEIPKTDRGKINRQRVADYCLRQG
jgi:oxalate---CoA ligase